jgi:RNA polymerase sigma-70 factor (ECF subfamily)
VIRPLQGIPARDFAALVEDLGPALLRFLRRMVGDADLAQDLLQETFVAAFRHRAGARPESARGWLFTIAANRARNALRDGAWSVTNGERVEATLARLAEADGLPEAEALRHELRAQIAVAVAQLPADSREAVLLRDMEDLPYAEVAAVLGLTEGAARVRVHRARERLREALGPYLAGELTGREVSR